MCSGTCIALLPTDSVQERCKRVLFNTTDLYFIYLFISKVFVYLPKIAITRYKTVHVKMS